MPTSLSDSHTSPGDKRVAKLTAMSGYTLNVGVMSTFLQWLSGEHMPTAFSDTHVDGGQVRRRTKSYRNNLVHVGCGRHEHVPATHASPGDKRVANLTAMSGYTFHVGVMSMILQ